MTRDEAYAILRREYGVLTMDDDPEWTEDMVQLLIAGDPSVAPLTEGDDVERAARERWPELMAARDELEGDDGRVAGRSSTHDDDAR